MAAQRDTTQRQVIRRVFEEADRPLSTREVLELARRSHAGIGIATVYRNIRLLQEAGYLAVIRLPGEPPRFERTGKPHHHHFHCRGCGRVVEVPGSDALLAALVPPGFVLEHHDLVLYGRCDECARAGKLTAQGTQ